MEQIEKIKILTHPSNCFSIIEYGTTIFKYNRIDGDNSNFGAKYYYEIQNIYLHYIYR